MSKKIDKTSNTSDSTQKSQKSVSNQRNKLIFLGEYYNFWKRDYCPITQSFIGNLADRLMEWSKTEDAMRIVDFTDEVGIQPHIFRDICSKFPVLNSANEYAKRRIGSRREQGAITRKFSETMIKATLAHYDEVFAHEMKIAREQQKQQLAENQVVIIERFPTNDKGEDIIDKSCFQRLDTHDRTDEEKQRWIDKDKESIVKNTRPEDLAKSVRSKTHKGLRREEE